MAFSPLHWVPSALAALLTFALAFNAYGKLHRALGAATVLLALLGLAISTGNLRFFPIDFHTFHSWIGVATLNNAFPLRELGKEYDRRLKEAGNWLRMQIPVK